MGYAKVLQSSTIQRGARAVVAMSATVPSLSHDHKKLNAHDDIMYDSIAVGIISQMSNGRPFCTSFQAREELGNVFYQEVATVVRAAAASLGTTRGSLWVFVPSNQQVHCIIRQLGSYACERAVLDSREAKPEVLLATLDARDAIVVAAMGGRFGYGADLRGRIPTGNSTQIIAAVLLLSSG